MPLQIYKTAKWFVLVDRKCAHQSLHGLDVGWADGQRLLVPALGLVHIPPQLCHLTLHKQHVMGHGEQVGCFLRTRCRLCRLSHSNIHLRYGETEKEK